MEMRKFKSEDLLSVKNIANIAWQPIFSQGRQELGDFIMNLRHPNGESNFKGEQVEEQINSGLYEILVCVERKRIVGFITYKINGLFGEICNNAALPNTGLKGIGQIMYRTVLDEMRQLGVKVVSVSTGLDEAHSAARRAYERAGFLKHSDSRTYFLELN